MLFKASCEHSLRDRELAVKVIAGHYTSYTEPYNSTLHIPPRCVADAGLDCTH